MHCRTCKFFELYKRDKFYPKRYGHCNCDKIVDGELFETDDRAKQEKDLLIYHDYEGHTIKPDIGEDFGCIHWEGKVKE